MIGLLVKVHRDKCHHDPWFLDRDKLVSEQSGFIGLNSIRMGCLIESRGLIRRRPCLSSRGHKMSLGNFSYFIPYHAMFFHILCTKLCLTLFT